MLKIDWATFSFLSGYDVDVITPKKTPKSKTNTPKKDKAPIVGVEVELEKYMQPVEEPMEMEVEHLEETTVAPQPPSTSNKKKYDTRASRRITRN